MSILKLSDYNRKPATGSLTSFICSKILPSVLLLAIPVFLPAEDLTFRGFELSGIDKVEGGYLIVDDELVSTSLFLPDGSSTLEMVKIERSWKNSQPMKKDLKLLPVQDFEAVASDGENKVWFLGSHNPKARKINDGQRGVRRSDREFLLATKWDPKDKEIKIETEERNLLNMLDPMLKTINYNMGLTNQFADENLNLEGLAYNPEAKCLYIGFRSPLIDGKAILVTMDEWLLKKHRNGTLSATLVDLGGRGIRGLDWDAERNVLLAIAGTTTDKQGSTELMELTPTESDWAISSTRYELKGDSTIGVPEGVVVSDGIAKVVYDNDSPTAMKMMTVEAYPQIVD